MGREIINLSVGQAGNQIGSAFWENILQTEEHGLDLNGKYVGEDEQHLDKIDMYFNEASNKKYIPRSTQIDLEPGVLEHTKSGTLGSLFRPDTYVNASSGAGNYWARGLYTDGAELVDKIFDVLRHQAEGADCLQGFQVIHSLGGGTGSGLGALLLGKIREEYSDRMLATFSVFPSPKVSETVVEPYNAVLSTHNLVENSSFTCCVDNEALYNICTSDLKNPNPEYKDLNAIVAKVMAGFTTTLRFPGVLNSDLRKLAVTMVPFTRLHFFTPGYAPLVSASSKSFTGTKVHDLTAAVFSKSNLLAAIDPTYGKYMTVTDAYRGQLSMADIENAVWDFHNKNSAHFVPWIPNSSLTTLCTVPPVGQTAAATLVANTTAISDVFKRYHTQFKALHKRRAFMMWYTGEGMDEPEFEEAESNLADLCNEYESYAAAGVDDEVDGDDLADEYAGQNGDQYEESFYAEGSMVE